MSQSEAANVAVEDHAAPHPNGAAEGRELHDLLRALQAMRMGDFSVRMAGDAPGLLAADPEQRSTAERSATHAEPARCIPTRVILLRQNKLLIPV